MGEERQAAARSEPAANGPRTLLAVVLAGWAVYRLILLAISTPVNWTYLTVTIRTDPHPEYLEVWRNRALAEALLEFALLALLLLRGSRVARWLLPPPGDGPGRVRPWIEAGVILCAVPAFVRIVTSVVSLVAVPYPTDDGSAVWYGDLQGEYGLQLAVLGLTIVFLGLPRLARRLAPTPVPESDA